MAAFYRAPKIEPKEKPKWKGPSASSVLTDEVIKYAKSCNCAARRVNTQGQYDENLNGWRPSGMKRGFEDIDVVVPVEIGGEKLGLKVAVEIKIKDTQFDKQKKRQAELEKVGAQYWIITSLDEFKQKHAELLQRIVILNHIFKLRHYGTS